jgi:hypothetical protein
VLCETPTYAGAIDSLMASRARIVPVPTDAQGLRVDRVAEALAQERVRLLFVNPTGNNATGVVLSDERRRALAQLSARTGLVVIEDDTGAELVHAGAVPPPVAAYEPEAEILLVKSFAKTVVPGLRLGVIHAPAAFDRRILAAKLVADRYTSPPLARALARYLERPEAAVHLERQRLAYGRRRDGFLRSLERRLGGRATWLEPRAGLQPLGPAAGACLRGGDLRPRPRARRHRLAGSRLRPARRGHQPPPAVVLDGVAGGRRPRRGAPRRGARGRRARQQAAELRGRRGRRLTGAASARMPPWTASRRPCSTWRPACGCGGSGIRTGRPTRAGRDGHLDLRRGTRRGRGGRRTRPAAWESGEVWERLERRPPTVAVVLKPDHVRDVDVVVRRYGARAFGPSLFWRHDIPDTELEPVEPGTELPGGSSRCTTAAAGTRRRSGCRITGRWSSPTL